jgi:hypothetical protein
VSGVDAPDQPNRLGATMTPSKQEYREKVIREYEAERIRRGVEFGECFCGCKKQTTVSPCNSITYGFASGIPRRFTHGHWQTPRRVDGVLREINGVKCYLIPLTQGQSAQVSPRAYEEISQSRWYAKWDEKGRSFYAMRHEKDSSGRDHIIWMHRQVLGLSIEDPREADHVKTKDTLNNTDVNLRFSTRQQQAYNKTVQRNSATGFKGVWLDKRSGKYNCSITVDKRRIHLGTFTVAKDGARTYDISAIKYHGEFACLNFPRSDYTTI